jgi:hypothetical protein
MTQVLPDRAKKPRMFGWGERHKLDRYIAYRLRAFNASLVGYETLRQAPLKRVVRKTT